MSRSFAFTFICQGGELEIKAALLGNKYAPPARLIQLAGELPVKLIREVLRSGRLSPPAKNSLMAVLEKRAIKHRFSI